MRLYRVSLRSEDDGSAGFAFCASQREAAKAISAFKALDPGAATRHADVEPFDVIPTKAGILAALNKYGGHPDNG
ncbi:MAG: hypothetical protein J2P55_00085 [Rhizobiales bacterium]|nr:hypothetical protein [Hyphomicrobiales bacterium]